MAQKASKRCHFAPRVTLIGLTARANEDRMHPVAILRFGVDGLPIRPTAV